MTRYNPTRAATDHPAWRLVSAAIGVLQFGLDASPPDEDLSTIFPYARVGRSETRLDDAMQSAFWGQLYIERRVVDQLEAGLTNPGIHILYGARGAGKTTALLA